MHEGRQAIVSHAADSAVVGSYHKPKPAAQDETAWRASQLVCAQVLGAIDGWFSEHEPEANDKF